MWSVIVWMCCAMRSTAGRKSQATESAAMSVIFWTLQEQFSSCNLGKSHLFAPFIGALSVFVPFLQLVPRPAPEEVLKLLSSVLYSKKA